MRIVFWSIMAALLFIAVAQAQQGSGATQSPGRAQFCAGMAAMLSESEDKQGAKLSLTPSQLGLFQHWRDLKIDQQKSQCANMSAGVGVHYTQPEMLAREEQMFASRLENVRAQKPALQAFYDSLTDSQKKTFDGNGN